MLVLFETAAGFALFKVLDEQKLSKVDNILAEFQNTETAKKFVQLKHFHKFEDTTEATDAISSMLEGKMGKILKKFLKKIVPQAIHEEIAVADAKLGNLIKEKFQINCVYNSTVFDLMRGIRNQLDSLIDVVPPSEMAAMSLGLAHSLSRYKLKFSSDKVDTMIIQTISLLDDIDKELNNYIMRCREWYGWHFPEMGKIVTDHTAYAKVVKKMGMRTNAPLTDLSDILPEEVEEQIKSASQISMGTEISVEDIENITFMCDQILEMYDYRAQLFNYLKNRVMAIAPNLSILVGELVAARLVAHAGSLMNLAKCPASTVQILGSEKAMFRALKTRHNTPKYGLLYHATLVGQATQKNKGKISRMLAAKAALATRFDALGETSSLELGMEHKAKLEARLRYLEQNQVKRISGLGKSMYKREKYDGPQHQMEPYDIKKDSTLPVNGKRKFESESGTTPAAKLYNGTYAGSEKKAKKIKTEPVDYTREVTNIIEQSRQMATLSSSDQTEAKSESKKSKKKVKKVLAGETDTQPSSTVSQSEGDINAAIGDGKTPKKSKKKKAAPAKQEKAGSDEDSD